MSQFPLPSVGSRDQTQIIKLGNKCFLSAELSQLGGRRELAHSCIAGLTFFFLLIHECLS